MNTNKNEQFVNNKPERRRKSLIRLGVKQDMARSWSRTRMGGWATAQSPILVTTITLKRLKKRGYQSSLDLYRKISPQFNEPLITWPRAERKKCSVNIFSEGARLQGRSGVRGSPRRRC